MGVVITGPGGFVAPILEMGDGGSSNLAEGPGGVGVPAGENRWILQGCLQLAATAAVTAAPFPPRLSALPGFGRGGLSFQRKAKPLVEL